MKPAVRRRETEKGTSLVEVVIALGILLILMIGVLQMFSMAYLTNLNAAASTELTAKAQQTAEVLRWALYQKAWAATIGSGASILPVAQLAGAPAPGVTYTLPDASTVAYWSFWGPSGVGVQTRDRPPYTITYNIQAPAGATFQTVTVVVAAKTTGVNKYVGVAKRGKVVEYVMQAPINHP
jgi:Tfp pilus assembly protein PilW